MEDGDGWGVRIVRGWSAMGIGTAWSVRSVDGIEGRVGSVGRRGEGVRSARSVQGAYTVYPYLGKHRCPDLSVGVVVGRWG